MNNIKTMKATFRKDMKNVLRQLSADEKDRQSKVVMEKLLALNHYQKSQRISFFLNMKDEVKTTEILQHCLNQNKICFIPRYDSSNNRMDMVRLTSWADYEGLPETSWNIKQPPLTEDREEALSCGGLELVLVPGMAFTKEGHRLGRGKGYYDRYLRKASDAQRIPPVTVALAFKEQIVTRLPYEDTDVPINIVLYDDDDQS